jgi:membrane fusion protein, multidrug efflux system
MKIVKWIAAAMILLVFALTITKSNRSSQIAVVNEYGFSSQAVDVMVDTVVFGDLNLSIQTRGKSKAFRVIPVVLKSSGYIISQNLYAGMRIKQHDLLVELDNAEQRIQLIQSRAGLVDAMAKYGLRVGNIDSAVTAFEAQAGLFAESRRSFDNRLLQKDSDISGFLSDVLNGENRTEVQSATTGLAKAVVAYKQALLDYRQTRYISPCDGIIGELQHYSDEYYRAGTTICRIYDLSKIKVSVSVLERDIPHLKMRANATVIFDAVPDRVFKGGVREINPSVIYNTCNAIVYLDNPDYDLLSGLNADVDIETAVYKQRCLVPRKAILYRDDRELLFFVRNKRSVWCYVTTGIHNQNYVEITSSQFDLPAGIPVVVEGHYSLAHNADLNVLEAE